MFIFCFSFTKDFCCFCVVCCVHNCIKKKKKKFNETCTQVENRERDQLTRYSNCCYFSICNRLNEFIFHQIEHVPNGPMIKMSRFPPLVVRTPLSLLSFDWEKKKNELNNGESIFNFTILFERLHQQTYNIYQIDQRVSLIHHRYIVICFRAWTSFIRNFFPPAIIAYNILFWLWNPIINFKTIIIIMRNKNSNELRSPVGTHTHTHRISTESQITKKKKWNETERNEKEQRKKEKEK